MTVQTKVVEYDFDGNTMEGYLALDSGHGASLPVVIIAHAWAGQGEAERGKAVALAELGYAGFAADLYGKGRRGSNAEENQALMTPLLENRQQIVRGMNAALAAARSVTGADKKRAAAIGFCFGGLCVLDLAR
ncbi:MAG: dienelactone hydrolase family protein, partial [Gammaproteobacteria bacterium]|nr:dienelactone hydrolase family protein [Gammaproteobacteria bacterium]